MRLYVNTRPSSPIDINAETRPIVHIILASHLPGIAPKALKTMSYERLIRLELQHKTHLNFVFIGALI